MEMEDKFSDRPWVEPPPFIKENLNFRSEKDPNDELALRENFYIHNPSAEVVRRRAKYRSNRWVNLIPSDQRFMVLITYGPQTMGKFDIES